jgi:hypothetical protein
MRYHAAGSHMKAVFPTVGTRHVVHVVGLWFVSEYSYRDSMVRCLEPGTMYWDFTLRGLGGCVLDNEGCCVPERYLESAFDIEMAWWKMFVLHILCMV